MLSPGSRTLIGSPRQSRSRSRSSAETASKRAAASAPAASSKASARAGGAPISEAMISGRCRVALSESPGPGGRFLG
jgi:hypothetical protein